jgi:hypothetical protein
VRLPLDHARTLLALGAAQRRAKRRREARATLDEALAVFEEIGAAIWAERARAELKWISARASSSIARCTASRSGFAVSAASACRASSARLRSYARMAASASGE